jgi:uncharacterized protein
MSKLRPFHAAYPVANLEEAKRFYKNILGCQEGRSDTNWIDFNFFGHQLVFHLDKSGIKKEIINPADNHKVPVPHFGVVLSWDDWHNLAEKLKKANINFIIEPYIRFKDLPGEQGTFFFKDPNGLNLEFKSFKKDSMLFEK